MSHHIKTISDQKTSIDFFHGACKLPEQEGAFLRALSRLASQDARRYFVVKIQYLETFINDFVQFVQESFGRNTSKMCLETPL